MNPNSIPTSSPLGEIKKIMHRTRHSYKHFGVAPLLFTWGTVWLIGYVATWWVLRLGWPDWSPSALWSPLVCIGGVCTWRIHRNYPVSREGDWRYGATWGIVFLYYYIWLGVNGWPDNIYQPNILAAITIMLAWVMIGMIQLNPIWIWLGLIITVLLAAGYFIVGPHPALWLWMAATGGGGMLVSGAIIRVKERRHE